MRNFSLFIGLFALVCSFVAIDGKSASQPAITLNKPTANEAKTPCSSGGTL